MPWSACGGFASRASMTRWCVEATGGFQRGGVLADGHPFRGATHRASHEHGLRRFTWRSTSTDGFRKTRVTHRCPRPSQLIRPREKRQHSPGVGRASTGLSYSSAYDKPKQVCGRTVTIVTVRPQQMLLNTRAKRRTAASGQSILYAWVRPPDCRRTEQIHTAAQEEHREEQQRDLRKGRGRRRHHIRDACPTDRTGYQPRHGKSARARSSNVYSTPMSKSSTNTPEPDSWHQSQSVHTRRRRSGLSYTGTHRT